MRQWGSKKKKNLSCRPHFCQGSPHRGQFPPRWPSPRRRWRTPWHNRRRARGSRCEDSQRRATYARAMSQGWCRLGGKGSWLKRKKQIILFFFDVTILFLVIGLIVHDALCIFSFPGELIPIKGRIQCNSFSQCKPLAWYEKIRSEYIFGFPLNVFEGFEFNFSGCENICCFARNPNKLLPAPITGCCCRYQISDFKNLRKLCFWPKLDPLAWKNAANVWWTAPVRWLSLKYTF